jgi:hypothetical protein
MPRALFAFLAVLLLALPARAATPLYDRQLVYNGAAELDPGTFDPAKARPMIGWHPVAGLPPVLALRYGAHGIFPKPDSPGASYHGRNFFWGGYTTRTARITIVMVREQGDSNDGYADNVSFTVHKTQAPAR